MDYIGGGELFYHLLEQKTFKEDVVRFYAAQLVLALSFLHEHNITYRDLKPENLLLDISGNICLCDFGLCKELVAGDRAFTLCGSAEYMAPEALLGKGYGKEVDWWALGIVIYEMITGKCCFHAPSTSEVHHNILYGPVPIVDSMSKDAMSLILLLLKRDPAKRLGSGPRGLQDIKDHAFFKGIDWQKILHRGIEPPFKPHLVGTMDLKYFDPSCTDKVPDITASPSLERDIDPNDECFGSFSYVAPVEVFQADHGISFIKGASFGKLPIFPHLERSYSGSPLSWNPLTAGSPRFSHSGSSSPRDSHSPHTSIMNVGTPPVFNTGTPPYTSVRKVKDLPLNHSMDSAQFSQERKARHSPLYSSSDAVPINDSHRLRRPFSLPDNTLPQVVTATRIGAATIGHVQSRQLSATVLDEEDGSPGDSPVLMQQMEHELDIPERGERNESGESISEDEGDFGITRRTRKEPTDEGYQRPSERSREAREARQKKLKDSSKDDKKLKRSFKDLFNGIFSKKN